MKPNNNTVYLVAYHQDKEMYVSICKYDNGKFIPINSIGDINGSIMKQNPNEPIVEYISLSNLNNLISD